jgi:hypothetical protein
MQAKLLSIQMCSQPNHDHNLDDDLRRILRSFVLPLHFYYFTPFLMMKLQRICRSYLHAIIDDNYYATVGASSQRAATTSRDSAETVSDKQGS